MLNICFFFMYKTHNLKNILFKGGFHRLQEAKNHPDIPENTIFRVPGDISILALSNGFIPVNFAAGKTRQGVHCNKILPVYYILYKSCTALCPELFF
jgi:hypothetical protein